MIIKRLTIENFGVYAGENCFAFTNRRPIVLIGGMNGHGKTTFLAAILLALYGENSAAYRESRHRSYRSYLRAYVNRNNGNENAAIELEFCMNESTQQTYCIRRSWSAGAKGGDETLFVRENGAYSDFLTQNWAMFVENILPAALARFFFFDGEKIAELAVEENNAQVKESIRAMLGISVLDVLKSDLSRILRRIARSGKGDDARNALDELRQKKEAQTEALSALVTRVTQLRAEVDAGKAHLDEMRHVHTVRGGDVRAAREELQQRRAEIAAELEQNQNALVDCAAGELPLVLVQDLVRTIKLQAQDEHNDRVMTEALAAIDVLLAEYVVQHAEQQEANASFLSYVRAQTLAEAVTPFYHLSDHALFQMGALVEELLAESTQRARRLLEEKAALQEKLDACDRHLALGADEQTLGSLTEEIRAQEAAVDQLMVEHARAEQEMRAAEASLGTVTIDYSRAREVYLQNAELRDDNARMGKYANMALQLTEAFSAALQQRKTGVLGETITACYKKLANKKHLIDRIEMDVETLDLVYLDADGAEVAKAALSAGEKQLMVIAILWALAICSKKKLPVIIDTPLARLDTMHRMALVTNYFPHAGDQTIILSTDAEIDPYFYEQMLPAIGDTYTLRYDEETKSTVVLKGYFQEHAD